jgi:hypothetical protein
MAAPAVYRRAVELPSMAGCVTVPSQRIVLPILIPELASSRVKIAISGGRGRISDEDSPRATSVRLAVNRI